MDLTAVIQRRVQGDMAVGWENKPRVSPRLLRATSPALQGRQRGQICQVRAPFQPLETGEVVAVPN